ncbi:MAG: metalloregulator ArsR/SmtB family transcription factor [Acidobacteriota bacterium]
MADPRRMAILEPITRAGEITCGELARLFPVGQPTVPHHLRVLERAKLLNVRRQGQHAVFSARRETLRIYLDQLSARLLVLRITTAQHGPKEGGP